MTPKRIIVNSTISHFLLMFSYKLLSAYFPLYLIEQGLSNPKIGYAYLLIYLPFAILSPVVGGLLHKVNPRVLLCLGIIGYGLYSLGLLYAPPQFFYLLQVMLGISAALFFVSSRVVIMRAKVENYDSAFGWFYSAPIYAQFGATAIGALIISYFGFHGVFIASFVMHILNMFLTSTVLSAPAKPEGGNISIKEILQKHVFIFRKHKEILPYIIFGFVLLIAESSFGIFFLGFLKNLGWSRDEILLYGLLFSGLSAMLSLFAVKILRRNASEKNILRGGLLYAIGVILVGFFTPMLNLFGVVGLTVIKSFGGLSAGSSRSGIMARDFHNESEEAGAVDTTLSPLATSIGALVGGFVVAGFGYQALFVGGGVLVLIALGFVVGLVVRRN